MRRSFFLAVSTLVGTTIGAGVFALPSLFARMGIWQTSLCFWSLTLLIAITYVLYVDVIVSEPTVHRLPGYVKLKLGKRWGELASFTHFFHIYGTNVIYLLLGGLFTQTLLAHFGLLVPARFGLVMLFLLISTAIWGGFRSAAKIELVTTTIMLLLFGAVMIHSLSLGAPATAFVPHPSWSAFGLILFALSGLPAIGELVELSGRKQRAAHRAALTGVFLSAAVIWLFAIAIARIGGTQITGDPHSIAAVLDGWGPIVIPLIGLFSVGTAYLCTAEDLQLSWIRDHKMSFSGSWLAALVPPFLIAFLLGNGFVILATVLGTICGGFNGIFVGMMRVVVAEQHKQKSMLVLALLIVFMYALGMSGQLMRWLFV